MSSAPSSTRGGRNPVLMLEAIGVAMEQLQSSEIERRSLRIIQQNDVFALWLQWFRERSVLLTKEAKTRQVLAPYATQLNIMALQQNVLKDEQKARRRVRDLEKRAALDFVAILKFSFLQLQYLQDRDLFFRRLVLLPPIIRQGEQWLRDHALLIGASSEEERKERYRLGITFRVETKETEIRTHRGNVIRSEQRQREVVTEEWEIDWIALYREFKLADCLFDYERSILAQQRLKEDEANQRIGFLQDEHRAFWDDLVLGQKTLDHFVEFHELFMHGIVGVEYVQTIGLWMTQCKLLQVEADESEGRLFLMVDQSNTFHRGLDVIDDAHVAIRRYNAAIKLQTWTRGWIAFRKAQDLLDRIVRADHRRTEQESKDYEKFVLDAKFHGALVVLPFLLTRISYKERHERRRRKFVAFVSPFTDAYLVRKDMRDVWEDEQNAAAVRREKAKLALALVAQRCGRAMLVREEICDYYSEVLEIERAELQKRHVAALAIQWMYREWQLRRKQESDAAEKLLMEIRTRAAVKIQSIARRMFARQFFTLILMPRFHKRTALLLQRVLRGAVVRRNMKRSKLAVVVQRFIRAFQSRRAVVENKLAPYARTIQCAFRTHLARKRVAKHFSHRRSKEDNKAKSGYATMLQAVYRGHAVRRRNREAAKLALQVRLTIAEVDASDLEDDLWRIGRGYLARKRMQRIKANRKRSASLIQGFVRALRSSNVRFMRQEMLVEHLCHEIMTTRVAKVQGVLRQKLGVKYVENFRRDLAEKMQRSAQLQLLLKRIHEGYLIRRGLNVKFLHRVSNALLLHNVVRGYRTRIALVSPYVTMKREQRWKRENSAQCTIAKAFRKHYYRRQLASCTIQRSFVLRLWNKLTKRIEVSQERRALYQLHLRSVARYEAAQRSALETDEQALRTSFAQQFQSDAWNHAMTEHRSALPRIELPDRLQTRMEHKRLQIEEAAVVGYMILKRQMEMAAIDSSRAEAIRTTCERVDRALKGEAVLRSRLARDELECRRALRHAALQSIIRIFKPKLDILQNAESSDRSMLEEELCKAEFQITRQFVAISSMAQSELAERQRHLEATAQAAAEQKKIEEEENSIYRADDKVAAIMAARAVKTSKAMMLLSLREGQLKKFTTPTDYYAPCDMDEADYNAIFGKVLPPPAKNVTPFAAGMSKSQSARTLAVAGSGVLAIRNRPNSSNPTPVSLSLDGPIPSRPLLPPLERPSSQERKSKTSGLSILQHPPDVTADEVFSASKGSILRDIRLMQEKAKDEVEFSCEGIVDSSPLGGGLTDDTICVVEGFLRDKLVTGLVLPNSRITPKALLHLLRIVRATKAPITVLDVSHNASLDDVVASHLVDAIEWCHSLVQVNIVGTSISPGKRLLISHLLERKSQDRLGVQLTKGKETSSDVRRPRPLQLPRRNGWSNTYKVHSLEPLPGVGEAIMQKFLNEKPEHPDW